MEEHEHGYYRDELTVQGFTEEEIGYHNHLLIQARLAEGVDNTGRGDESPSAMLSRVTWEGHEFLDAARDEGVWRDAKEKTTRVGGAVAMAVMVELLKDSALRRLGLKAD
jgi:hypothetical protein